MRNTTLVRVLALQARLSAARCSLEALSRHFHVSTRTIRRDLDALSQAGVIVRHRNEAVQGPDDVWWIDK